jgi:hypothetical protein
MKHIRAGPVYPYAILYRVVNDAPEIVRVLHERRHFAAILSEVVERG